MSEFDERSAADGEGSDEGTERRALPIVAIVGRPNVGKSTLFNRLAGERIALVLDQPGVTRDRHYTQARALGYPYVLVDTGGFDPDSSDPLRERIVEHARAAIAEADLVIAVLEGSSEPTAADRAAVDLLRRSGRDVIFLANKLDRPHQHQQMASYYELGMSEVLPVSALHGHGMGELEERIAAVLAKRPKGDAAPSNVYARIAIVGRPNAGKSSLVNALLKNERQIVDDRPGTTVDSIDTPFSYRGHEYVLIDTAGMRRQRSLERGIESLAVMQALRAIERSDIVVLLLDGTIGAAEQDARIAGMILERGRALVVGINKSDLLTRELARGAAARARETLGFVSWAPFLTLSATKRSGLNHLMRAIHEVVEAYRRRVPTAKLNRFFADIIEKHPPPTMSGRAVRINYITQAATAPPTFVAMTNEPSYVHFSYQRYVVNQLRKRFGFDGTPVHVIYRRKSRRRSGVGRAGAEE